MIPEASHSENSAPERARVCRLRAVSSTIQSLTHSPHCTVSHFVFSLQPNSHLPATDSSVCVLLPVHLGRPVRFRPCDFSIIRSSIHLGGLHPVDSECLQCQRGDPVFQHQDPESLTHTHFGPSLSSRTASHHALPVCIMTGGVSVTTGRTFLPASLLSLGVLHQTLSMCVPLCSQV